LEKVDPFNKLLARQSRMRLDAEIIRDSALVASGLLTPTIGGPSVHPPIPPNSMTSTQIKRLWPTDTGPNRYRRGLYTFFYRMAPPPSLALFDAPDAGTTCTRRVRSDSPLQALTLLNDEAFLEFAVSLAKRTLKEAPSSLDRERIEYAFLLVVGHKPGPKEFDRLASLLAQQRREYQSDTASAALLVSKESTPSDLGAADTTVEKNESIASANPREVSEMAAWTALCRALLNLDDFMTRE
jgi:hypothetical protein